MDNNDRRGMKKRLLQYLMGKSLFPIELVSGRWQKCHTPPTDDTVPIGRTRNGLISRLLCSDTPIEHIGDLTTRLKRSRGSKAVLYLRCQSARAIAEQVMFSMTRDLKIETFIKMTVQADSLPILER